MQLGSSMETSPNAALSKMGNKAIIACLKAMPMQSRPSVKRGNNGWRRQRAAELQMSFRPPLIRIGIPAPSSFSIWTPRKPDYAFRHERERKEGFQPRHEHRGKERLGPASPVAPGQWQIAIGNWTRLAISLGQSEGPYLSPAVTEPSRTTQRLGRPEFSAFVRAGL